jgi:hypothetical protein
MLPQAEILTVMLLASNLQKKKKLSEILKVVFTILIFTKMLMTKNISLTFGEPQHWPW